MTLKRLQNKKLLNTPPWLIDNVHYEAICGSRAYNTHNLNSDYDVVGFTIPPKRFLFPWTEGYIIGFDKDIPKFEQFQAGPIIEPDSKKEFSFSIYNIVKYFSLVAENNPNMLDSLFVPEFCVKHCTKIGQEVRDNRKMFLSKLCWTKYRQYAASQLHKVTHEKPTGNRVELIKKFGYDTKFGMNVIRLLSQCETIFATNDLDLTRNNEELKAIRRGEWSKEKLIGEFETRKLAMEQLFHKSNLPEQPDINKIKDLLIRCIDSHYKIIGTDAIQRSQAEIIALREIDKILNNVRNIL